MRKTLFAAMAIAGLCLVAGLPAFGQLNDITRSGLDLTPEDWELMEAAAAELYLTEEAPVGTVETWSNDQSGNRGSIELIRTDRKRGVTGKGVAGRVDPGGRRHDKKKKQKE